MASLTILHFNDVYNIEGQTDEPAGGAARLAAYVKSCKHLDPLVLFSGDALNPSLMSIFLKGEQMIPVLNEIGVKCAVYGNHDFDFGVDHLEDIAEQTTFPWLLSNIKDNVNEEPLAQGEITCVLQHNGIKLGIIGLVEEEWIATLSTVDSDDITFLDFVDEGRRLACNLKEQGADIVIALTHMRWPNDEKLAENVPEIDIVLGGHDHDFDIRQVNGRYVLKSGTDFRNLSKLTLMQNCSGWDVSIERVDLTSDYPEDAEMKELVNKMLSKVDDKMDTYLGTLGVDMDGRFGSVRTMETNLGNFITDIMLTATNAEVALLNSGTLRSDRIHRKGDFRLRDLLTILPLPDPLVVIQVSGMQLLGALENGVSQYPRKEGRFPQVAGVSFGFNPTKPPGHRVPVYSVRVQGECLDLDKCYRVVTKEYLATGHDGYDVFRECEWLVNDEQCPALSTAVQNYFESVQIYQGIKECKSGHRQPLVPVIMKDRLVRQASVEHPDRPHHLVRQESIHDAEAESSYLSPHVEGRIFILTEETCEAMQQMVSPTVLHHNLSIIKEASSARSLESLENIH
ncbi:hypothetical protein C0Q70_19429 [Pomacea canaliculata]|uniref:5'-Nucleotidase C-terminal domain-containing protein n=1 Tax=Pomacea canaliculata TaxID=400727 RepID=A0A2T7NJC4_POMCA|nr:uncharacterized protein LOC112576917 isoform X1 [Pomacea canaliculata]XP_025115568.1 uncharacterized protein LOC112576917 isoform X1 [Pomacea canaliculata]XP_025115569.1 uncharacterized protein LOC112576917 isoform X1 [Pomacea canaliculata]XP_025115570.1 uncharacterized protein LOC112576917 isoform X1 [Pomacea canaliculata]XP_025115571.1 uncharacterized protein LOC112576917 isoform X1 [Pomacea canaliculata]PVD21258.1 hypothetical protein C0Q70_19429 [Pomacea canaliculata]